MDNTTDNDPWAGVTVTNRCDKCGRRLAQPGITPAYCPKCELVNALLVERYSTHVRAPE